MLIGVIRPTESADLTAEGESLEAISRALQAQTPDGWELVQQKVSMPKGSTMLTATGRISRWGELREIQAEDLAGLRPQLEGGWQLLSVRRD